MKLVIADDEPLARRRLQAMLADCGDVDIVASVGDGNAALQACREHHPDAIMLDIRMPGLDGLAAARQLRALDDSVQVVFCTAFEQHAVDAWEVRASDYLLKPVSPERLQRALARVRQLLERRVPRVWLHSYTRGERVRIALAEVLYLSAGDKYVSAHLGDDQVLLDDSLKSLLEAHPERLIRLHRSCLIPRERLLAIRTTPSGGAEARIDGSDTRLEVSRRNLPALRKLLRQ